MTEEGKSPKPNAGISLLPWKTQNTRFPHSHCPTTTANLSLRSNSENKNNTKNQIRKEPSSATHPVSFRLIFQLEKTAREWGARFFRSAAEGLWAGIWG